MINLKSLKHNLIEKVLIDLDDKVNELHMAVLSAKESRASDTKSSAGDKFETGRSMMQMEIEKNESQLQRTLKMKHDIEEINYQCNYSKVEFGSLVQTDKGIYLISVPLGKVTVNTTDVFCITMASPVGQAMAEKLVDDTFEFNGLSQKIIEII